MKTKSKVLLLTICLTALIVTSMFGTIAYLTDAEGVTNTFTVGKVKINLDEAVVKEDGTQDGDKRTEEGNTYHLLPGHTYVKDPTVTIDKDSEDTYVRMVMTVHNANAVQAIIDADDTETDKGKIVDYADLFTGWQPDKWLYEDYKINSAANTITFEFRYYTTVNGESGQKKNGVLEPLFTELIVPEYVTGDQLAALYGAETDTEGKLKIEIVAHAIQAAGFENNEDAAWSAFDSQIKP